MVSIHSAIIAVARIQLDDVAPASTAVGAVGGSIFPVLGWLLAIVFAGMLGVFAIRRWMRQDNDDPVGFTLGDLREMLESGDITQIEFDAARAAMIAQVKRQSTYTLKNEKYTPRKRS